MDELKRRAVKICKNARQCVFRKIVCNFYPFLVYRATLFLAFSCVFMRFRAFFAFSRIFARFHAFFHAFSHVFSLFSLFSRFLAISCVFCVFTRKRSLSKKRLKSGSCGNGFFFGCQKWSIFCRLHILSTCHFVEIPFHLPLHVQVLKPAESTSLAPN